LTIVTALQESPPLDPYRLPRGAVPTHYDVELAPDLAASSFDGRVEIAVDVVEPIDELVLNAIELDIAEVRVDGSDVQWHLEPDTERLVVSPVGGLQPGVVSLVVSFTGTLNDKLRGFYRSTFKDDAGIEHVIATTQMQATDCRRAFPCWDEPDFKATFGITLVIDPALTAVSNGPEVERTERPGGKVAIRFADTMVMSTYLVAFVVGPLEATDAVDVDGIPLRVIHVPGKGQLAGFGLDVGAFCLRWFQQYYGIPYPSDKVDLLALPDFAAGAMENLGAITFRENALLVDPATATVDEQMRVADVVAHELAHMWFGDLVTMRWWNGIWLNEAFATFMELIACNAYRPDWDRWTLFGLERSVAFETDSLASTRPVEYPVLSPSDCEGMFDVLTYQKGGALLRMLEQFLGEEAFRAGVSHYLKSHAYGNTETNDLWDAIEATTQQPVRRMMDSWIWQPGYPLVTATVDGDELVLRQQRFAYDSGTLDADPAPTTWLIPVHVRNGATVSVVLLDGAELRTPLAEPAAPVVVNAGGRGFYRVGYSDALRDRLTSGDTLTTLGSLERYSLVDDAWQEVVAGRLAASDYLTFIEGFGGERELAVWQAIVLGLRGLGRLLDDDAYPAFQARAHALLAPAVAALGDPVEGEDDVRGKLRGLLVAAFAIQGADAGTRAKAAEWFAQGEREPGSVHPELVAAATSIVANNGDEAVYETMLAGYHRATTPQEQLRHLNALAEFDSEELVLRTCELAMTPDVKTQNAPFLLRLCIGNRRHGAAAWTFVRQHWDQANEAFPRNTIVRMIGSVTSLTDEQVAADVQSFFAEHPIEQAAKTLEQVLERQRVNTALKAREHDRFAATL
jgi:puromycin-sensitive aminopeptidase